MQLTSSTGNGLHDVVIDVRHILREKPGSFLGYFLPLLILQAENDKLLDVVELFGFDKLVECVEKLGGSRVEFPTWATVDALVADAYLLYLLDSKQVKKAELERAFDSTYEALMARAAALRRSLGEDQKDFPGVRAAERYNRRLRRVQKEIQRAVTEDARD